MDLDELFACLTAASAAVAAVLVEGGDRRAPGSRPGQYAIDLAADAVACDVLLAGGFGVLSEESGLHEEDRPLLAVLDPLDGSTNAARGVPWFATSIAVLDHDGPLAGLVVNQANGTRYEAARGRGARRDGEPIGTSGAGALAGSFVGLSGHPGADLGWAQFRALGASALDICAVADGTLDAFLDCVVVPHGGAWDFAAASLICTEAGGAVVDRFGRDLVVRRPEEWRAPLAAASPALLGELEAAFAGLEGSL